MNKKEPPGGSRIERKKEETRRMIVATAIKLIEKQGIDATTMEQIALEADIAKGTLYNYFPVKEAIINEYVQRIIKEIYTERIMQFSKMLGTRARLIFMLEVLIEAVQEQKELFEKYLVYQIQNTISHKKNADENHGFRLLAREILVLGQDSGEIRTDLPLDILVALFEFVFIEVAQKSFINPKNFNFRPTIESCVDLYMNGAKYEAGKQFK